ncbi:trehalose-phosphatase [Actibacterium ureilyticum]|uniref:trehalose-phosphatase n=1 Tax=Actibacterium ureilyticum TaxID=1590614 RepID=UPI00159555FA|nr:trehalose-phosphatase [Actibacterium ureilyticum]
MTNATYDHIRLDPDKSALFLDFDGTLVDIAPSPSAILVPADLVQILNRLNRLLSGALAIVTGRNADDVLGQIAGFEGVVSGSHGAELRWPGQDIALTDTLDRDSFEQLSNRVLEFQRAHPALLVEQKPASVTLHYRNAEKLEDTVIAFANAVARAFPDFEAMRAKKCVELKLRTVSKAQAIAALMQADRFQRRQIIFAGDDLTDARAFPMIRDRGGCAISVGTILDAASHHAASPAEFVSWLRKQVIT